MTQDRRRYSRVAFPTAAYLQPEAASRCEATLLDLSLRGALLAPATDPGLMVGASCRIGFALPGSTIELDFEAEVVRVDAGGVGVRFTAVDLETMTHLRALLEYNTGDPERVREELFGEGE